MQYRSFKRDPRDLEINGDNVKTVERSRKAEIVCETLELVIKEIGR